MELGNVHISRVELCHALVGWCNQVLSAKARSLSFIAKMLSALIVYLAFMQAWLLSITHLEMQCCIHVDNDTSEGGVFLYSFTSHNHGIGSKCCWSLVYGI